LTIKVARICYSKCPCISRTCIFTYKFKKVLERVLNQEFRVLNQDNFHPQATRIDPKIAWLAEIVQIDKKDQPIDRSAIKIGQFLLINKNRIINIWLLFSSYEWFIPFTYSIENTETPDTLLAAKNFNITNIHQRVIWIRPEDKESIYKLCVYFKFELKYNFDVLISLKAIIELESKLEKDDFILANLDAHGFYRINYDENNWNLISKQLLKDVKVNKNKDDIFFLFLHKNNNST
jgi:hypothetical protein